VHCPGVELQLACEVWSAVWLDKKGGACEVGLVASRGAIQIGTVTSLLGL
jgi:hypothetical protein